MTVRKMKDDLDSYTIPPTLAAANDALIADLTNLATAIDGAHAQMSALGDNYGGAYCCFFGVNAVLQQELVDVRAITG
jgi:hypothetical protein